MPKPLTVYFDGLCPLCSREIEHYRKRVTGDSVTFIDITEASFSAAEHGLDAREGVRTMHVKLDGELHTGLAAFLAIWGTIPGYRWLQSFVGLPGIRWLCGVAYAGFARLRPLLPRRTRSTCETEKCRP